MSKIFEIQLEPLGHFFFGGEVVFGGALGRDKRRRSYLVHSQLLPQQTALLGMLRENILRVHDELITEKADQAKRKEQAEAAAGRVGTTGFALTQSTDGFGCIEALSPLVLKQGVKTWQPHPMDDITGKDDAPVSWDVLGDRSEDDNEDKVRSPGWWLKNLDAKAGLPYQFSDGSKRKKLEDLLRSQSRVGVRVTNRKYWRATAGDTADDDEEGFYRQTFRATGDSAYAKARANEKQQDAPPPALKLAFRVTIDTGNCPNFEKLDGQTVQLGGERSTFRLTLQEVQGEDASLEGILQEVSYLDNTRWPATDYQRIILLSDTYLDLEKIRQLGGFVVGQPQPFRYFSANLRTTENFQFLQYGKAWQKKKGNDWDPDSGFNPGGRWQSRKHTLLLRGSLIIAPAAAPDGTPVVDKIKQHLESQTAFRQIGYNYYKIK